MSIDSWVHYSMSRNNIPSYFIDPETLLLFQPRIQSCIRGRSVLDELMYLRNESASEFFRSHELLSYHYFVELNNPYRTYNIEDAEFEYIPILPLSWRASSKESCGYHILIQSMLKFQEYYTNRIAKENISRPLFTIASTFNLRTELGKGMPTQQRKGLAWTQISDLIMSMSIGHYERWSQCPDLLRKHFKNTIEIPYIPMNMLASTSGHIVSSNSRGISNFASRRQIFYFVGHFQTDGADPNMVCSIRNTILQVSNRVDLFITNTTLAFSNSPVLDYPIFSTYKDSIFCIITKSESYSSSSFYHAIAAGCIPIVICDWFVFSYPWIIPYDKFVIRIQEADFLKNPNHVLDLIKSSIFSNKEVMDNLRRNLEKYRPYLSFDSIPKASIDYNHIMYGEGEISNKLSNEDINFQTIIPFELFLLELRYTQSPHAFYNNIPCLRPLMCYNPRVYGFPLDPVSPRLAMKQNEDIDYIFPDTKANPSILFSNSSVIRLVNEGYQVNPIEIDKRVEDIRSHLCKHVSRLIGSYKIVYFMQCVRVLWPLQPGKFKPADNSYIFEDRNIDRSKLARKTGITEEDYKFVVTYHNITHPPTWKYINYPSWNHIKSVNRIVVYDKK